MVTQFDLNTETIARWEAIFAKEALAMPFFRPKWHEVSAFTEPDWQPFYLLVNDTIVAPLMRLRETVTFSGNTEIADYLDIVGPPDAKKQAWDELIPYLKSLGIKKIELHNVAESSGTYAYFKAPSAGIQVAVTQEDTTPIVSLPSSWDEYQEKLDRHSRHELRRKLRKFDLNFPNAQILISQDLTLDTHELLRLMKLDSRKAAFLTPLMETFFLKLPQIFEHEIQILTLRINDVVAASTLSFVTSGQVLLYNSGFDEVNYTGSSFYLKAHGIKMSIEKKYTVYNFLQGNERYKYELGGKDFFVYTIMITM
jgi:hypothetical protein